MPRAMKQALVPDYSDACRRVLDFTPEQFAACVDSGYKPVLLTQEENRNLSLCERAAIARHVADLMDGFAKIKGWVKDEK